MTSRNKNSPQVHQIKAIFEGYRHPTDRPAHASRAVSQSFKHTTDGTMPQVEHPEQASIPIAPRNPLNETIDTVIETAPHSNRPKLNSKPSWVGALPRTSAPAVAVKAMPHKVTIKYQAPDLLPPVYITTSLSDPQWDVLEMEVIKSADGTHIFLKDFEAVEGEYQYKFRLGPGDWWVCDENQPTIDDGDGNRNNVLIVSEEKPQQPTRVQKKDSVVEATPIVPSNPALSEHTISAPAELEVTHGAEAEALTSHANVVTSIPHVAFGDAAAKHADEQPAQHPPQSTHAAEEPIPLLKHETSYPGQVDEEDEQVLSSPASSSSSRSSGEDIVCPEADPNDPSLRPFPTHHSGILDEIHHAQRHLPEDITTDERAFSPLSRQGSGLSLLTTPPLPKVQEEGESDDILVMISDNESSSVTPSKSDKSRLYNHSHGPAHHHRGHHRSKVADEDMHEEKVIDEKELPSKKSSSGGFGEIFFGFAFATVVVVIAVVMYSSGMFSQQDTIKDGGAALGG